MSNPKLSFINKKTVTTLVGIAISMILPHILFEEEEVLEVIPEEDPSPDISEEETPVEKTEEKSEDTPSEETVKESESEE